MKHTPPLLAGWTPHKWTSRVHIFSKIQLPLPRFELPRLAIIDRPSGGILHHEERGLYLPSDHYRQLQVAEVLFNLSTMNDKSKSSFVNVSLVITKYLVITRDQ
jgi:hypothetical protein